MSSSANVAGTACNAVFNTVELLEAILLDVDVSDLLKVQLVCRACRETVRGSSVLQQQLFLQPSTIEQILAMSPGSFECAQEQPSIRDETSYSRYESLESLRAALSNPKHRIVLINPLAIKPIGHPTLTQLAEEFSRHGNLFGSPWFDKLQSWSYISASHSNMLVCQPPVSKVSVKISMRTRTALPYRDPREAYRKWMVVKVQKGKSGVTIGDVFRLLQDEARKLTEFWEVEVEIEKFYVNDEVY